MRLTTTLLLLAGAMHLFSSSTRSFAGYVEYTAAVQADLPVNYWHLSESLLSAPAADVGSGGSTANNGAYTATGVALQQAGPWPIGFDGGDRAAHFDGIDGYVQAPDDAEIDLGAGNFTISMWLKKDSNAVGKFIYNQRVSGGDYVSITYSDSVIGAPPLAGPSLVLDSWIGSVQQLTVIGATNLFDEAIPQWHHIAFTVDRASAADTKLIVDGVDQTVSVPFLTGADLSLTAPLNIGQWGGGGARFDGLIDEVAMFHSALGATRLQQHHAAALVVPEPTTAATLVFGIFILTARPNWRAEH